MTYSANVIINYPDNSEEHIDMPSRNVTEKQMLAWIEMVMDVQSATSFVITISKGMHGSKEELR